MAWLTRRCILEREILLPRARVWELLANTDHLNRVVGLEAVQFSPVPQDAPSLFHLARAKVAGLLHLEWKENPFQWVQNEEYSVERPYQKGPVKRFFGGIRLTDGGTPLPDGSPATKPCVFAGITPANLLRAATVRFTARTKLRQTIEYCESYIRLQSRRDSNLKGIESASNLYRVML